jgi:hypothetical protein
MRNASRVHVMFRFARVVFHLNSVEFRISSSVSVLRVAILGVIRVVSGRAGVIGRAHELGSEFLEELSQGGHGAADDKEVDLDEAREIGSDSVDTGCETITHDQTLAGAATHGMSFD